MTFSREVLTRWATTRGIDASLFGTEEEWELLGGLAELHCAEIWDRLEREQAGPGAQLIEDASGTLRWGHEARSNGSGFSFKNGVE